MDSSTNARLAYWVVIFFVVFRAYTGQFRLPCIEQNGRCFRLPLWTLALLEQVRL